MLSLEEWIRIEIAMMKMTLRVSRIRRDLPVENEEKFIEAIAVLKGFRLQFIQIPEMIFGWCLGKLMVRLIYRRK